MHVAKMRMKQVTSQAINAAITEQIMEAGRIENLIEWKSENNGKVFMLNSMEHINIAAKAKQVVSDVLCEVGEIREHIPLGRALNNAILASYGPNIPIRFVPEGSSFVELQTRQREAGINNFLIEIYIRIKVEMTIVIPFDTEIDIVTTDVPISYLLIVGDVPLYYFDGKGRLLESMNGAGPLPPSITLPNIPFTDDDEGNVEAKRE